MRAYVLQPDLKSAGARRDARHGLAEGLALAAALPSIEVVGGEIVPLPKARPGLLFGSGKIDELRARFDADEIGLVIVDGPVTPVQQRNLERAWKVKVLDRTGLILEIFADRASTREGVLQVELAALEFQKTRLVRSWTHLERQRGGLGFVGGPGETQLEADRRALDDAVVRIRRQLSKVVKTRGLHRAARRKVPYPVVALVGYTNSGKSTLFNTVTGAGVLARDMLFATLDPTMRAVRLLSGHEIILSDTVGFISDLPTQLVAAFRATLEEVLDADLILHVRDIAHPQSDEQAADVRDILESLGVSAVRSDAIVEVWNKIDLVEPEVRAAMDTAASRSPQHFAISALTGEGLPALLEAIDTLTSERRREEVVHLPFERGRARAWLFDQGVVESETETAGGHDLTVSWTDRQAARFHDL